MELPKTKSEALQILCQYYGQTIKYGLTPNQNTESIINAQFILWVETGHIFEFSSTKFYVSFPNIRSLDEMTEEETKEYMKLLLGGYMPIINSNKFYPEYFHTPASIDYARKQGIDVTGELKGNTIVIKEK